MGSKGPSPFSCLPCPAPFKLAAMRWPGPMRCLQSQRCKSCTPREPRIAVVPGCRPPSKARRRGSWRWDWRPRTGRSWHWDQPLLFQSPFWLRASLPPLPDLRRGLSAGKALAPQLCADWQALRGTYLPEALGITEVSTYLSGSPGRPVRIGIIGYAQVGRRTALLGDDGQPIAPGQPGQIAVHLSDPELLLGYLDLPDETDARFSGAWFLTGDWAHQRPDGAFVGLGRREDLINAGGSRVALIDEEAALPAVPGPSECAVTAVGSSPARR